jgi:hypothetical protein
MFELQAEGKKARILPARNQAARILELQGIHLGLQVICRSDM